MLIEGHLSKITNDEGVSTLNSSEVLPAQDVNSFIL